MLTGNEKRIVIAALLIGVAAVGGLFAGQDFAGRPPLIIDTDMALDDVRSLYALCAQDRFELLGIVTVDGSASLGKGTDHLLGLMESLEKWDVPLFRGEASPGLPAPPWRGAADGLGGVPFPPPRVLKARTDTTAALHGFLCDHAKEVHYLALGPLTNLARLETEHPGALESVRTLWIPVRFEGDARCTCWNLAWDETSTKKVFEKAPRIVLIDLTPAEKIDAGKFLASVDGPSPAALWIRRLVNGRGASDPHIMLFDEMAAAALIDPELLEVDEDARKAAPGEKGFLGLSSSAEGNVRIARLKDVEGAMAVLKRQWEKKTMPEHAHDLEGEPIPVKRLLKSFHGHLGPYVVLGYRMGRLALRETGSKGHFDISAEVSTLLEPPPSCLLDGLQLGCGCTLGKRNIEVRASQKPAEAVFTSRDGRKVLIRLKPEVPDLIRTLVEKMGVEAAGEYFLDQEVSTLFEREYPE